MGRTIYSFIVDSGAAFAYQGWLLARSLCRECAAAASDVHVHVTDATAPETIEIFRAAGYHVHALQRFGDGRWCNKLAQLPNLLDEPFDVAVLLDTDMIAVDDLRPYLRHDAVVGKVVDFPIPPLAILHDIYRLAGGRDEPPIARADAVDAPTLLGNCNGGFFGVPRPIAGRFSAEWRRWALWLLEHGEPLRRVARSRHVDQVSAALAFRRSGVPFAAVCSNANYFLHVRAAHDAFDPSRPIALLHHHGVLDAAGLLGPSFALTAAEAAAVGRANSWIAADRHPRLPPASSSDPSDGGPKTQHLRRRGSTLLKEGRYGELIALAESLGPLDTPYADQRDTLVAHARLALARDKDAAVAAARKREASTRWLSTEALLDTLRRALREHRPFAFIRLGDGEARFAVTMTAALRSGLSRAEAWAVSRPVWEIWFQERIDDVDATALAALMQAYSRAVKAADVLGVSSVERLSTRPNIFGYLAAQEAWLRDLLADRADTLFADALAHFRLNEASPFLADLLAGLDFVGVIGPHPELADRLAERFAIAATRTYLVPGESVLPRTASPGAATRHFPERFREIMTTLTVPRPGALFLVAAGLLGKVYCARIKEIGGIGLDIGAIADVWMGFDTRPGFGRVAMPSLPGSTRRDAPPRGGPCRQRPEVA